MLGLHGTPCVRHRPPTTKAIIEQSMRQLGVLDRGGGSSHSPLRWSGQLVKLPPSGGRTPRRTTLRLSCRASVSPNRFYPFGMIDERIPVSLNRLNASVTSPLPTIDSVLPVPGNECA